MALNALSWQVGFALGPGARRLRARALADRRLARGAAALCALGGVLALAIEGALPTRARRTPVPSRAHRASRVTDGQAPGLESRTWP